MSVLIALVFLFVNVVIMLAILYSNRREGAKASRAATPAAVTLGKPLLDPSDILGWEFEYARITASEAMQDRHTMVNFYLVIAGAVAAGVVAVMGKDFSLPKGTGTVLLWVLVGVGWLYFLKLIRLRQAWHDSARAMNQIKEFYIENTDKFAPEVLRTAFLWQSGTLPPPDKNWTVFFYSAALIALLDSVAYVAGGALIDLNATLSSPGLAMLLTLFGLAFFVFHVGLYFAFLRPQTPADRGLFEG